MLQFLPENRKWYFDIFHTIIIAGIVGFVVSLAVLTVNNFLEWVEVSIGKPWLTPKLLTWIFPVAIIFVLGLTLLTKKETQTSYISYFIQHKLRLVHNLTELKIEMFYISEIMRIRKEQKTG